MADETSYLDQVLTSPRETPFGVAGNLVAQSLPALVSPYSSPGSNFAAVLGGGLLAGLLKYGAKQEAESQNAALMPKLLDVMGATSRQDLQSKLTQPGYEQLGSIGARLQLAMMQQEQQAAQEKAKETAQLQRQQILEGYKATLMNNPDVQQALRKKLQIQQEFAPPSLTSIAAVPPTMEELQAKRQAESYGTELGKIKAKTTEEYQQIQEKNLALKLKEHEAKQTLRLENRIKELQTKAEVTASTEAQKQEYKKEIQALNAELRNTLLDKQLANKTEQFNKKFEAQANNEKLSAKTRDDVGSLMDLAVRAKDVAKKMREVPNFASLKLAELLPMFDKNLAISDIRDLTSLAIISRTGAAAAIPEYKRLQQIIQNPRATPSELVARLERFVELTTQAAETQITANMTKPKELLGLIRNIHSPNTQNFQQLKAEYEAGNLSVDEYKVRLHELKAKEEHGF